MAHSVDNCIFCQIIAGRVPCYKIHEDDLTMTFLDAFPSAPGHLLIVTKTHFRDLLEAEPDAVARVAANSVRIARAMDRALEPDGLGVYQLNREAAGQTVFHYHMHLIPRHADNAQPIHAKAPGKPEELADIQQRLVTALGEVPEL